MTQAGTVATIMTQSVIVLGEEDNLSDVLRGMHQLQIRHVPVVDEGKLVGLVSQRDVLRLTSAELDRGAVAVDRREREAEATFVHDIMTRDVVTVRESTSIEDAARLLVKHRFGCLPVVDSELRLVGIVSESDLLAYLVDALVTVRQEEQRHSVPLKPIGAE